MECIQKQNLNNFKSKWLENIIWKGLSEFSKNVNYAEFGPAAGM